MNSSFWVIFPVIIIYRIYLYKKYIYGKLINKTSVNSSINLHCEVTLMDNYNLIEADDILDYFDIYQLYL